MSQILHFFSWFQLWYFAYSAWSFSFFVFRFLSGIYLIKRVYAYEVQYCIVSITLIQSGGWSIQGYLWSARSFTQYECKQNSREFFCSGLWEFLLKFLQETFMSRILHFFVISTLIFCSLCLMFSMFCVLFLVGGYLIKRVFVDAV